MSAWVRWNAPDLAVSDAAGCGRGAIAKKPRLLVLYQQLFFGGTRTDLMNELIEAYPGEVAFGNDLVVY